MLIRH